eukprot:CAMPEP_0195079612 /NCGR_PEP_ID=MMETSP0448-20130528/21499_1 /TAXON_ID=66468 /ORGANISM="Heterocapsa triquestra, Strain CCMP 448" /LENGTH=45 /DNA_ID= /DNA_START= /DNA_END= /DNA_ORIENTATION=
MTCSIVIFLSTPLGRAQDSGCLPPLQGPARRKGTPCGPIINHDLQ